MYKWGWTRWRRGRWEWGTPLSTDASTTSKDAAVLTEDQVNTGRTPWMLRRNVWIHIELGRTKEEGKRTKGKEGGEQVGQACTWGCSWSTGERPHVHGRPLEWGSHLKLLGSELTNLWPSEQSENHTDKPGCRLSYLGQGCESTGVHGSWELEPWGLRNDPRVRSPVDCGQSADGMAWRKSAALNAS